MKRGKYFSGSQQNISIRCKMSLVSLELVAWKTKLLGWYSSLRVAFFNTTCKFFVLFSQTRNLWKLSPKSLFLQNSSCIEKYVEGHSVRRAKVTWCNWVILRSMWFFSLNLYTSKTCQKPISKNVLRSLEIHSFCAAKFCAEFLRESHRSSSQ